MKTTHTPSAADSAPKHTPGPWRFLPVSGVVCPATGNGVIAKIPYGGPDPMFPRPDIAEADAALIAAAPELLAALKALTATQEPEIEWQVTKVIKSGMKVHNAVQAKIDALSAARAAIAKAEGRA